MTYIAHRAPAKGSCLEPVANSYRYNETIRGWDGGDKGRCVQENKQNA